MNTPAPNAAPHGAHRLFNRDFVLLWQGQLVSQLGNQAFYVAMMFWTMQATGSASLMGLLLMVSALPSVLLTPVGGTFADRHSRRGIILGADVLRGLAVLALAGLMFLRPGDTELIISALFVVSVTGGVVGSLFQPAIAAAIPDLVPKKRVAAANSLNQFSVQGAVFTGQAAGGILFQLLGAHLLFLFDGLTYLFSAVSELFIRIPQKLPERTRGLGDAFATYSRETRLGLAYVWQRPGMRDFLLAAAAVNFFFMPVFVLLPFHVEMSLGAGAGWYGFLLAALAAGSVGGYILAGSLRLTGYLRSTVLIGFLFGAAVVILAVALLPYRLAALGLFFVLGIFSGAINIFVLTIFQVTTPGEMRGRVMGLVYAISGAAAPAGMALGGAAGDLTGKNIPLLYGFCSAAVAATTLAVSLRRPFREFLAQEVPEDAEPEGILPAGIGG